MAWMDEPVISPVQGRRDACLAGSRYSVDGEGGEGYGGTVATVTLHGQILVASSYGQLMLLCSNVMLGLDVAPARVRAYLR